MKIGLGSCEMFCRPETIFYDIIKYYAGLAMLFIAYTIKMCPRFQRGNTYGNYQIKPRTYPRTYASVV